MKIELSSTPARLASESVAGRSLCPDTIGIGIMEYWVMGKW